MNTFYAAYLYLLMVVWVVLQVFWPANPRVVVIELWAVEAFVFRLLLLLLYVSSCYVPSIALLDIVKILLYLVL
jgi:hypothetical protein